MIQHVVLILSSDLLAAALLGAAVELAGYQPVFSKAGEPPRAALLRLRPQLVLVTATMKMPVRKGSSGRR